MNSIRNRSGQAGFTLIELVVVIVLLGILGVTALGKFQDLSTQAADAAEQGVASELSSAAAINYAASVVGTGTSVTISFVDCVAPDGNDSSTASTTPSGILNGLMASGTAPTANYEYSTVSGTEGSACSAGQTFICGVRNTQGDNTSDATATIICTGP